MGEGVEISNCPNEGCEASCGRGETGGSGEVISAGEAEGVG